MKYHPTYPVFKVRKKGKTVGRPSKAELIVQHMANITFDKHRDDINAAIEDAIAYGYGEMKIGWKITEIKE